MLFRMGREYDAQNSLRGVNERTMCKTLPRNLFRKILRENVIKFKRAKEKGSLRGFKERFEFGLLMFDCVSFPKRSPQLFEMRRFQLCVFIAFVFLPVAWTDEDCLASLSKARAVHTLSCFPQRVPFVFRR